MQQQAKQKNEISVILNIIIFLTVISFVGLTRVFVIYFTDNQNLNLSYIESTNLEAIDIKRQENYMLSSNINKKHNIDIYFGEKTKNYADIINANLLTDNDKIKNMINTIDESLIKYPAGLIKEIENKGYSVTIFLVDSFKNDNIALANRTASGDFRIYLSYCAILERAFHHELYHVLDYYIKLNNNESELYMAWENNNPKGFVYIEDTSKLNLEYVYKGGESLAYFVTAYAKYNEKEDRAETFAQMMIDINKKGYYDEKEMIYNKMIIIKNTLYTVFESISNNNDLEYFERYL